MTPDQFPVKSGNSAAIAGMQMASNSNNAIIFFMSNTSCMHQAGPQKAIDNTNTYYNLSFSVAAFALMVAKLWPPLLSLLLMQTSL
jgi:hypothetical protein